MRKIIGFILLPALCLGVSGAGGQHQDRTVKVGVFPIDPIVWVAPGEKPRGFLVDLVSEVARQEHWHLVFVPGTWNEGLERLKAGSIDLMTAVAFSENRRDLMQFNSETVLTVWGQVFSLPEDSPLTILDLQNKKVALAAGDINGANFRDTAQRFGVICSYLEVPTHEDIFRLIENREVDAGVAPNIYGVAHAVDFGVVGTAIIFSPVETRFAAPKNADGSLLRAIDAHLQSWKQEDGSYYYSSMDRWLGRRQADRGIIPLWIPTAGGIFLVVALILLFWNRVLNRKFQARNRELEASEAKQRAIFDQSFGFIGLLSPEGILLEVNQTALDFIGAPASEVLGKPFWDAPWWSHSVAAQEEIRKGIKVAAEGKVFKSEATHPAADGSLHYIQFSVKGIRDESGKVRWLVPEGRDVTEYKETREQLSRLAQAMEQTAESVIITDTGGLVDYINPAFIKVTGFKIEDVRGRNLQFLSAGGHADGLYSGSWFQQLGANSWRGRASNLKSDGGRFEVDVSVSPIMDDRGGVIAYVVLQRDMTQVDELERSLRQAQRMEAVGTLAAGIAHDFNNILAAIFGYTELAQLEIGSDSVASEYLGEIIIGAERARALVRQILAFGHRSEQEWSSIELPALVREVVELMRSTLPTTIAVVEKLEAEGRVLGDPGQIHQVLMNLCTNAFQVLEDRGGVLEISLSRKQVQAQEVDAATRLFPGSYMVLEVKDNGLGMDSDLLGKIFEPYFTTKELGKGTGLGLAVVHGIVQAHHGKIEVESRLGKGTSFRVLLPEFVGEASQEPGFAEGLGRYGRGEHILFVDDEEVLVRLAKHFFTAMGYRVSAFSDSRESWGAFRSDPDAFDVVVSDQTMPGMTGIDLASQILALKPGIPYILCTGYSADVSRESAAALGISRFVQKPVEMEKLGSIVRAVLDAHEGPEPFQRPSQSE